MKILLTGATGFIGSHLARILVREGRQVYAIVRPNSRMWRIQDIAASLNVVRCDLLAFDDLDECLTRIRPDLCLHLAWYAEPGKYLTSDKNVTMLEASLHLACRLGDLGCQRFVAAGSCFEYDTSLGYLSETSLTKPRSLYAATKLALQSVVEHLASIGGMEFAWVRIFSQYGPFEERRRLVPSVICSLLHAETAAVTAGDQIRDFLHVEDVAAALWAIARSDINGAINIGSGQPVAVREIVTRIGDILDRRELISFGALPISPSDPMFICANIRRLLEGTTWRPRYDLDRGLRQTVAWWQAHLETIVYPSGDQLSGGR